MRIDNIDAIIESAHEYRSSLMKDALQRAYEGLARRFRWPAPDTTKTPPRGEPGPGAAPRPRDAHRTMSHWVI